MVSINHNLNKLVGWDAALVGMTGRAPFLQLLYASYSIPWYTVITYSLVDIAALVIPQYFLASSVPPHTPYDDLKLTSYTSLLSATFLSLPLYYLSSKFLPMTLVTYFDAATSVKTLPLPTLIAMNLPTGYALQTLLTRYGVKGFGKCSGDGKWIDVLWRCRRRAQGYSNNRRDMGSKCCGIDFGDIFIRSTQIEVLEDLVEV